MSKDDQLDNGFYTRMLPQKERGVEALGGLLNPLGAALALGGIFILPLRARHRRASCSRARASR